MLLGAWRWRSGFAAEGLSNGRRWVRCLCLKSDRHVTLFLIETVITSSKVSKLESIVND